MHPVQHPSRASAKELSFAGGGLSSRRQEPVRAHSTGSSAALAAGLLCLRSGGGGGWWPAAAVWEPECSCENTAAWGGHYIVVLEKVPSEGS